MAVEVGKLEKTILAIKDDAGGAHLQDRFHSLSAQTAINAAEGQCRAELRNPYYSATKDLDNLLTIVWRVDWQKGLWTGGNLDDVRWIRFIEADVHLFHVEFRSLFDHLASIIRHVADKPGQVKIGESTSSASFEKLRNWVTASRGNANRLGTDLAAIVESCGWFDDLREVRNALVHQGGTTTTFIEGKGRVLFQVHDRNLRAKVLTREVMYKSGIVDFERYAGVYLGYLLELLDEVGSVVHKRLRLEDKTNLVTYRHPALSVVRDWVRTLTA